MNSGESELYKYGEKKDRKQKESTTPEVNNNEHSEDSNELQKQPLPRQIG